MYSNQTSYVADNVNHKVRTVDGQNTFPAMMIATITPWTSHGTSLPCLTVSAVDVAAVGYVFLQHFLSELGLQPMNYMKSFWNAILLTEPPKLICCGMCRLA